jgi:MoxR-like ATPase
VIATQNPIDHAGTYPLPEAQLDRFGMKLSVGYPSDEHAMAMLTNAVSSVEHARDTNLSSCSEDQTRIEVRATFDPVLMEGELLDIQRHVQRTACEERVRRYLVDLATASRQHPQVTLGVSPRGLLAWQRLAQAKATLIGRDYVTADDVQAVARPCLLVRLGVATGDAGAIIDDLLESVAV